MKLKLASREASPTQWPSLKQTLPGHLTIFRYPMWGLTVATPLLIVELVALVGGYNCPLGPTISGDLQAGSNPLTSLEASFYLRCEAISSLVQS